MFDKHKAAAAELERHQVADRAAIAAMQAYEALEAARLTHEAHVVGIVLKKAEVAYFSIQGAALIEPRRAPGQWSGGSHGVSFRVAKGVSYRVGASRGTFTQGAERPTVIDTGLFVVTNQRCLFVGTKRTTEWLYSKLIGFSLDGHATAIFNVSNRQKASGVFYGSTVEHICDIVIAASIAQFQGADTHASLLAELDADYRIAWQEWQTALSAPAV